MSGTVHRRTFLGALAATGLAAGGAAAGAGSDRVVVGVMGTGGRGTALAREFAHQAAAEVAYVCDVDRARAARAAREVARVAGGAPKVVGDFRHILDDRAVDALVVATPNHWHAPATILACAAGKHIYVEKPCAHNPREGEWLVQAARRHRRLVQMGNQRRSWPRVVEAVEEVRGGVIGRPYLAQSWYRSTRPSIGRGRAVPVPAGLDYELWQGPAPRRPFHDNYLPYTWHWFWHWGNGELGNNGIHFIDLCRWGLGVDHPIRVASAGGRYRYCDDQETPDTHVVAFDFEGRRTITWEGLSCNPGPPPPADVVFHGEKGSLAIRGGGYTVHDAGGKEIRKVSGAGGDTSHVANFLAAVRTDAALHSEIAEGATSTLLCHLGNIAHRVGRSLHCDPRTGHVQDDPAAAALWTREYAPGWEPRV